MSTITHQAGRHVTLEQIRVPDNVRALDDAHVQALAGSNRPAQAETVILAATPTAQPGQASASRSPPTR